MTARPWDRSDKAVPSSVIHLPPWTRLLSRFDAVKFRLKELNMIHDPGDYENREHGYKPHMCGRAPTVRGQEWRPQNLRPAPVVNELQRAVFAGLYYPAVIFAECVVAQFVPLVGVCRCSHGLKDPRVVHGASRHGHCLLACVAALQHKRAP